MSTETQWKVEPKINVYKTVKIQCFSMSLFSFDFIKGNNICKRRKIPRAFFILSSGEHYLT